MFGVILTDLWLAAQLRPYGIKPRTVWIGNTHAKGYAQEDLADTFRRYISTADLAALKAESAAERKPTSAEQSKSPPLKSEISNVKFPSTSSSFHHPSPGAGTSLSA
jgi:hypothetical protein